MPPSIFSDISFDHVALVTRDYEALTSFYRDAFGFHFTEE